MNDIQLSEDTAPKLSIITGGKGSNGSIWLKDLENGTVFLTQALSNNTPFVQELMKLGEKRDYTWLADRAEGKHFWAHTVKFSHDYDLKMLLIVPSEHESEEGEPDG